MTISYEMTTSDNWALARYFYSHDRWQRLFCLVLILAMPLMAFANLRLSGLPHSFAWLAAAVAFVIWTPFIYLVLWFRVRSQLRAWPAEMRRMEISLADDGVHVTSPKAQAVIAWDGVVRIAENRRAVYLFLAPRIAYIAPARAFGSGAERAEFVAFASSHIAAKA